MDIDLKKVKKVYFIGIKGSGMIAFVEIFNGQKKVVVGSDIEETFFTDETLRSLGIDFYEGFDKENIKKQEGIDLVVYSTAYNEDNNVEFLYAKENGIKMISYPELVSLFIKIHFGIAVCGTHGKTTTTAMLALAMKNAGADPTAIVGSKMAQVKSNVLAGASKYFVVEADEYQDKLSQYQPLGAVLTNVDFDHPDFFKNKKEYQETFLSFVRKIPSHGFLVAWGEDAITFEIAKQASCRKIFYGLFEDERLYQEVKVQAEEVNAKVVKTPQELSLRVPGKHNLLNATAAFAVCGQLGLPSEKVIQSLNEFRGTARRFEFIGESGGAILIDDYAHHPEEIKVTLLAAKERYPEKNIICVFHPHTFSRTEVFLSEFAQSFDNADEVVVLDVYGSARENEGGANSEMLATEMKKYHQRVEYISTIEEVYVYLQGKINENDVVITMGAGNVWELNEMLSQKKIS